MFLRLFLRQFMYEKREDTKFLVYILIFCYNRGKGRYIMKQWLLGFFSSFPNRRFTNEITQVLEGELCAGDDRMIKRRSA